MSLGLPPGPISVFRGSSDEIISLESLDQGLFVSGSLGGEIRCWELRRRSLLRSLQAHSRHSSVLSINRICGENGKFLR
jgi:WD40 repeat protein